MKNPFRRNSLNQFEREIVANVDKHGCHIMAVYDPESSDPSFAYSIGFTKTAEKVGIASLPEVILFGVPNEVFGPAINEFFQLCVGGFEPLDGARLDGFFGEYDCVVKAVHPSWLVSEYFGSAIWYHETQMKRTLTDAVMLVWPDSMQLMPWEDGCEEWVIAAQPPLYSPRLDS